MVESQSETSRRRGFALARLARNRQILSGVIERNPYWKIPEWNPESRTPLVFNKKTALGCLLTEIQEDERTLAFLDKLESWR